MYMFSFQKYIVEGKLDKAQRLVTVTHVRFNVTACLYLSPSNRARSLFTLIAASINKDTIPKKEQSGKVVFTV